MQSTCVFDSTSVNSGIIGCLVCTELCRRFTGGGCFIFHFSADSVLPKHNANPMIRVHKLENIQVCLNFLKQQGVPTTGVHADGM